VGKKIFPQLGRTKKKDRGKKYGKGQKKSKKKVGLLEGQGPKEESSRDITN